jgi:hypothetical protein
LSLASPHDPSRPADCSRRAGHHKRSALTAAMSGRWMRCFCPDSRWLEHGRGVVPRIWMPHEYIGPGPARVLRPRAHAGRKRPAGHLARPLDDGRLLDATRNFSLSHRTHQAKLPERRPETGPWQERRGGCGKSSEHDHYFPSRADRFTGLFLKSRKSFLVSDVD